MPKTPHFSIVTVCRDNLKGLQDTYNSIKNQSFSSFEWVVIDGNSKDGSIEYLKKTSPHHLISETDQGPYDAMNKAIPLCNGKYTIFLNAGDELTHPNILQEIINVLRPNTDFFYGDSYEKSNERNFYKNARSHEKIKLGMFTHHQAMLYKTSSLKKMRYNLDYKIAADYDLTIRFLKQNENVQYWPDAICIFKGGGLSQQKIKLGRKEQFIIRRSYSLCSNFSNTIIYVLQSLNHQLRHLAPKVYWLSKRASLRQQNYNNDNGS